MKREGKSEREKIKREKKREREGGGERTEFITKKYVYYRTKLRGEGRRKYYSILTYLLGLFIP